MGVLRFVFQLGLLGTVVRGLECIAHPPIRLSLPTERDKVAFTWLGSQINARSARGPLSIAAWVPRISSRSAAGRRAGYPSTR